MNQVGIILKTGRDAKGWSQAETAKKVGLTQRGYAFYETGDREPEISTLIALARHLEVGPQLAAMFVEHFVPQGTFEETVISSLKSLAAGQLYLEAHITAGLHQTAVMRSAGNARMKEAVMEEINIDVADLFRALRKRGTVAGT